MPYDHNKGRRFVCNKKPGKKKTCSRKTPGGVHIAYRDCQCGIKLIDDKDHEGDCVCKHCNESFTS